MSKPIAEVLKAASPLHERIRAFLRGATPGQAYSLPEIYVEVEGLEPDLHRLVAAMWAAAILEGKSPAAPWAQGLEQLVSSGDVLKSTMNGIDYYWADPGGEK